MLATGYLVTSTTAFRVSVGCAGLMIGRVPRLAALAVRASVPGGDSGSAQAAFRDDLIALARESAEVSWREVRRGLDDLDAYTRPEEDPAVWARPYRVVP